MPHLNVGVGVAALIQITHVWASTIGVDLMNSNGELTTSLNLGDLSSRNGILGVFSDINVTRQLSAATLVDDVGGDLCITNDSGILLARVDSDTVAGDLGINWRSD